MYTKKSLTYQNIHREMCELIVEYLDWHARMLKKIPNYFAHKARYLAKTLSYLQKKQMGTDIRILDLGCSIGDVLMTLKHFGFSNLYGLNLFPLENEYVHVYGDRVSEDQRFQKLKASFFTRENSIKFYQLDMETEKFPFDDASMDLIFLFDVFEHLHFPLVVLKEMERCLVPGGTLICATPNQSTLKNRIRALFGRSIYFPLNYWLVDRRLGFSPSGRFIEHIREYTSTELKQAMAMVGLKCEKIYRINTYRRKGIIGTTYSLVTRLVPSFRYHMLGFFVKP